jgi:hypothetical protein
MYSECNTGNANSGINDDPAMGQHGMQDCAFEIDNGACFSCFLLHSTAAAADCSAVQSRSAR